MGSAFFNFSRRATRDADRMEIQKCDCGLTWVGARDACLKIKKVRQVQDRNPVYETGNTDNNLGNQATEENLDDYDYMGKHDEYDYMG